MRPPSKSVCGWGPHRLATGNAGEAGARAVCPPAFADLQPLKFLGSGAFANVFMCRDKVRAG
eukprot:scaffold14763_cov222-Isochrysis_galbana.AAC.1